MRARLVRWASLVMCCAVAAVCFAALAEDIISLPITLEGDTRMSPARLWK